MKLSAYRRAKRDKCKIAEAEKEQRRRESTHPARHKSFGWDGCYWLCGVIVDETSPCQCEHLMKDADMVKLSANFGGKFWRAAHVVQPVLFDGRQGR